jgi:hypothetical protein
MAGILIQKDPQNLVYKDVTAAQRLVWAQDFTIYDVNADGSKGAAYGPTVSRAEEGAVTINSTGGLEIGPDGAAVPWSASMQAMVSGGGFGYLDRHCDAIVTGLSLPASGSTALAAVTSGVAWITGLRTPMVGTLIALTASKDNYVDLHSDGYYTISPVTIAAAAPAIAANSLRLGYVTTGASTITSATTNAKDSLGNWMGNRVNVQTCILKRYINATLGAALFNLSFPAASEVLDNASMYASATPTRITIQATGLYRVAFDLSLSGGQVDSVRMKAGAVVDGRFPTMFFGAGILSPKGSFDVFLTAGEYIEMQITPNGVSIPYCYYANFAAVRVG